MSATISAPRKLVKNLAALRLPRVTDRRLTELMDRNNDGKLTPQERKELQSLAALSEKLSLLRADALSVLGQLSK